VAPTLQQRLVRWAFTHFYREFAWSYDTVAWLVSRGLWARWVKAALPYLKGRTLELGFGTGHLQQALAARQPHATFGLDASPQMLALTRRRLQRNPPTQRRANLIQGQAQNLPFATASFETVLATFPSEYIFHPMTLAEIHRVLCSTGFLLLVDAASFLPSEFEPPLAPPQIPYQGLLEQEGFKVKTQWVQVEKSRVMLLFARPGENYGPNG